MKPTILMLHASGTNRDGEAARAMELAGGAPEIVHLNQLRAGERRMADYDILLLPGGFSYGDALGAGARWALELHVFFHDQIHAFVDSGKPVLGICNGFQALVKSGWLPGPPDARAQATLTRNASNHFECRWVWLEPNPESHCVFTKGLVERIYCPVAHGEGRFVPRDDAALEKLRAYRQIARTYAGRDGGLAG